MRKQVWYSIRVVRARNHKQAIKEVIAQAFDETNPICDRIFLAKKVLIKE